MLTPTPTLVANRCICAAIRMPDGIIIRGRRHYNCIFGAVEAYGYSRDDIANAIQGFITSEGLFVDRTKGMRIQRASGIPSRYGKDGAYIGEILFSEDLY